jgi:1-deoxy-D-xylulose 5-phosphate reductoisomerase
MSFEVFLIVFYWILRIYSGIILIDVILSWIPSLYQYKIFRGINKMASYVLEPFRGCVIARLDFSAPDFNKFPSLNFAYTAGKQGGSATTSLNAINEEAVMAFLAGKIQLPQIYTIIENLMPKCTFIQSPTIDEIFELDKEARELTLKSI